MVDQTRRHYWGCLVATATACWSAGAPPARAIFWNNDPAHGATSTTGLTDRIDWFQNVHTINNTSNNTFGTTTLLDSEWAISVRHVVQNGGNYGQITAPENVYVNVLGTRYYADQIFTPDGGSEIALVHLRGGVNGALDARSQVNSGFDDAGRLVHVGGYGYSGYFGAGTTPGLGSFHRAYNLKFTHKFVYESYKLVDWDDGVIAALSVAGLLISVVDARCVIFSKDCEWRAVW